jgi:hypothetical protein
MSSPIAVSPVNGDFSLPAAVPVSKCTEAALADYIVTGNKRDFPTGSYCATRAS